MKIKASWKNDLLVFTNVAVKKESETFYGVYEYSAIDKKTYGKAITSATTLSSAAKKAKLIEIGYKMCSSDMYDYHYESCSLCSMR